MTTNSSPDVTSLSPTDRNLWQAIVSEALAHLTYSAYSQKAMEEGLPEVAQVFQEVAGAETIHGINHLRVAGDISDTESNLKQVMAEETREYSRTYPRMIREAQAEGRTDAVRAFTLAMEREKLHQTAFFQRTRSVAIHLIFPTDAGCLLHGEQYEPGSIRSICATRRLNARSRP